MNYDNIKTYIKNAFVEDGVTRKDVYTNSRIVTNWYDEKELEFDVHPDFSDYIYRICNDGDFYHFCCEHGNNIHGETIETIQQEIIDEDDYYNEEELNDKSFIYSWYLLDRIRYCLQEGFDFFVDILNEMEKEKD